MSGKLTTYLILIVCLLAILGAIHKVGVIDTSRIYCKSVGYTSSIQAHPLAPIYCVKRIGDITVQVEVSQADKMRPYHNHKR